MIEILTSGLPLLLILGLLYGWLLHAYLHYRVGRQEEFLHFVTAAAEAGSPLAPALRSYADERPERGWRAFWHGLLWFFVLPGSYWLWYRRNSYDRKLKRLALRLEEGEPLHVALRSERGIASGPTRLAITVGESTGQLATSLRRAGEGSLVTVWLETLPRLLYPLVVLFFLSSITSFWLLFLFPRIRRIFQDFNVELPELTLQIAGARTFLDQQGILTATFLGCQMLILLVIFSPRARWYAPAVGRVYRMSMQSRVLKMLAVLVEAGKPLPEALTVLIESGAFSSAVETRLEAASTAIEQGERLPESLCRVGLLPRSMVPLVTAAERARNLPWALAELGDSLGQRARRLSQRLSLALFVLSLLAVSVIIGVVVVGMFLPLIRLILEVA